MKSLLTGRFSDSFLFSSISLIARTPGLLLIKIKNQEKKYLQYIITSQRDLAELQFHNSVPKRVEDVCQHYCVLVPF